MLQPSPKNLLLFITFIVRNSITPFWKKKSPYLGRFHIFHFSPNLMKVLYTIIYLSVSHKITSWTQTILASKQETLQKLHLWLLRKSSMLLSQSDCLCSWSFLISQQLLRWSVCTSSPALELVTQHRGGLLPTCMNSIKWHGVRVTKLIVWPGDSGNLPEMQIINTCRLWSA